MQTLDRAHMGQMQSKSHLTEGTVDRGELESVYQAISRASKLADLVNEMADRICGFQNYHQDEECTAANLQAIPSGVLPKLVESARQADETIERAFYSGERISKALGI